VIIWTAKVGHSAFEGKHGLAERFDTKLREIIEDYFMALTGRMPEFVISSWDGALTPEEKVPLHDRYPDVLDYMDNLQKPGT